MIQIVAGGKGKGKTTYMLELANNAVKDAKGSLVYMDKSSKHMYELSNKIRLINVGEFPLKTPQGFVGFVCGVISQDHDIEMMYLDNFLTLAQIDGENISEKDITHSLDILNQISDKYNVDFTLSIALDASELPDIGKEMLLAAL